MKKIIFVVTLLLIAISCEKTPVSVEDSLINTHWLYDNEFENIKIGEITFDKVLYKCMIFFKTETECEVKEYIALKTIDNLLETNNNVNCTYYISNDTSLNLIPDNSQNKISSSYLDLGNIPFYSPNDLLYTGNLIIFNFSKVQGFYKQSSIFKKINNSDPNFDKKINLPALTTSNITQITDQRAISGGHIFFDGGTAITARGVCWSKNQSPTLNDNKTVDGTGEGGFISSISQLEPNTKYYVRAYATNSNGTQYGKQFNFTTKISSKEENEAQFAKISADISYTRIASQSGYSYIMYKELKSGNSGIKPNLTDNVIVTYTGWYKVFWTKEDTFIGEDGNLFTNKVIFDSTTYRYGIPSIFNVKDVIVGLSTALLHMEVGDKWEIWIPWQLGFGETGSSTVNGFTTLVYELELLDIRS